MATLLYFSGHQELYERVQGPSELNVEEIRESLGLMCKLDTARCLNSRCIRTSKWPCVVPWVDLGHFVSSKSPYVTYLSLANIDDMWSLSHGTSSTVNHRNAVHYAELSRSISLTIPIARVTADTSLYPSRLLCLSSRTSFG
jgi:hypothetical protein